MKPPPLDDLEQSGVHPWTGDPAPLATAARAASLRYRTVDLARVNSKADLMEALASGLGLPGHFGSNWDALADSLEDDEWLDHHGAVVVLQHTGPYRKAHGQDWSTLEDILTEAAEYWRELRRPLWVFVH